MRISIHWLQQYVDIDESPEELAEMLTLLGFEAEIITDLSTITGVVTARIRSVEPHPNADKLHLCRVDAGEEPLSIVCGAPNVAEGQIVPLAKIGAILPGGFKIKKARIRGEVSFGMLCSERELGISDRHEGILILPDTTEPGLPISEILNPIVAALELDITPNRPDALSHIGIAREIAAKTGRELRVPDCSPIFPVTSDERLKITLAAPDGCPRYLAGIVANVQVGPSPEWMVRHLEAAGQRSINNLVDISNYVLLEMGHPTHIFDLDRFGSREVLVRFAEDGEKFRTLDEEDHVLSAHHLLITNGKKPVALAGIMGGEDSAVTDSTRTVLIESAYFDPVTIRKGSKSLGLLTEASRRFERGADPDGVAPAFYRIVSFLQQYAGGTLVSDVVDAYPKPLRVHSINLRRSEAESVTGLALHPSQIEYFLKSIDIRLKPVNSDEWECTPPSFRPDLTREIDLIEEIARLYGYDEIDAAQTFHGLFQTGNPDPENYLVPVRQTLIGLGFYECYNNSLVPANISHFNRQQPVAVLNPLTEEMTHLRTSLYPGLLSNLQVNFNYGNTNLQLFEIGNIHLQEHPGFEGVTSRLCVSALLTGLYQDVHVHNQTPVEHNFYTGKGIVATLVKHLTGLPVEFISVDSLNYQNGFDVKLGDRITGHYGEISTSLLKETGLKLSAPVFGFTFYLDVLAPAVRRPKSYRPINSFPGIERDLNFVFDTDRPAGNLEKMIRSRAGEWLISVRIVDVFTHSTLGAGKKSVLYRLYFQSHSKTLEDSEVNPIIDKIIKFAEKQFGAKLRS